MNIWVERKFGDISVLAVMAVLLLSLSGATRAQSAPDAKTATSGPPRWTAEKARAWADAQPWTLGCNYIPRTAINTLEMWQEATFDPLIIDEELGWAEDLG